MCEAMPTARTPGRKKAALVLFVAALVVAASLGSAGSASASATFTVNSTGDENDADFPGGVFDGTSDLNCDVDLSTVDDQCTMRAAIQEANLTADQDGINFNIPGTGVKTIKPASALPGISQPVIVDGYTQPGSRKNDLAVGTDAILKIQFEGPDVGPNSGFNGLDIDAPGSVVRGLVINRFRHGIQATGGVILEGNFIGTDVSGTQALGNSRRGVLLFGGSDSTIGQGPRASRNLISGNEFDGILVYGTQGTIVVNNLIGTAKDGKSPLANGENGIEVDSSSICTVGTDFPEGANTIAFNGIDGVRVFSNSQRVTIARNSIFSNTDLGIDLDPFGITPNDSPGDTDGMQNFPVLTSATTSTRKTTVRGTLDSTGSAGFWVRFFSNPKGTDEGKKFIGKKLVATDATGHVSFTFTTSHRVAVRQAITAAATSLPGDTSEFSAPKTVRRP
jgi:hypothetical protein